MGLIEWGTYQQIDHLITIYKMFIVEGTSGSCRYDLVIDSDSKSYKKPFL